MFYASLFFFDILNLDYVFRQNKQNIEKLPLRRHVLYASKMSHSHVNLLSIIHFLLDEIQIRILKFM